MKSGFVLFKIYKIQSGGRASESIENRELLRA
jgi:hypothetical protein